MPKFPSHLILAAAFAVGAQSAAVPCMAQTTTASALIGNLPLDDAIESLMATVRARRASLPGVAFDLAIKVYDVYRTYQNGQAVEAVRADVKATLRTVLLLVRQRSKDRESILQMLEIHARTLKRISETVLKLDQDFRRPLCRARQVRKDGKCVDVADLDGR